MHEKTFKINEVNNLLKNIKGIIPLGQHGQMFNDIISEWSKNPMKKGEYYNAYNDYTEILEKHE